MHTTMPDNNQEVRLRIEDATATPKDVPSKNSKPKKSKASKQDKGNRIRLLSMLTLTLGYFLVEIIVGYLTGSMALVADSFHMLSDVISLIIAYLAIRMSPKKWSQNTFGWARAEVLGALINAVFLIALCFTIVAQSLERFIEIKNIEDPKLVLIVGTVGLVVNLIGLFIFRDHHGHSHGSSAHGHSHANNDENGHHHSHNHSNDLRISASEFEDKRRSVDLVNWTVLSPTESDINNATTNNLTHAQDSKTKKFASGTQMNMHGVFLHVLADALGSVIVIISALIIWLTEWKYRMYVDPLLSLIMVMLIVSSTWPLLIESSKVLLQGVPTHIQIDELKNKLLSKVGGAVEIHECHVWQLSGNRIIASAHILCDNNLSDFMKIGEEIKQFFHDEGIHSTTIQLEFANNNQSSGGDLILDSDNIQDADSDTRSDCFLTCPFDDEDAECVSNSCCRVSKKKIMTTSNPNNGASSSLPNSSAAISTQTNLGYTCDSENASPQQTNANEQVS